jgi:hypothetical protein
MQVITRFGFRENRGVVEHQVAVLRWSANSVVHFLVRPVGAFVNKRPRFPGRRLRRCRGALPWADLGCPVGARRAFSAYCRKDLKDFELRTRRI